MPDMCLSYTFLRRWLCRIPALVIFLLFFWSVTALTPAVAQATRPDKVTIAYNIGNPPLKFANTRGEADGILIDLWRLWGKKTGIEVEFKEALFADTLELVKQGKADIHAGLFYTEKRDQFLDYTTPIFDITYYAFHHESISRADQLDELLPFRIGVPKGYTRTFVEKQLPQATLAVYDNFPVLYEAAVAGDIRVFISPQMNLDYFLSQKKITNPFRFNPAKPIYSRTYLGAVSQDNTDLLNIVNQGLAQITPEEQVTIERKWIKLKNRQEKEVFIIAADSDYAPFSMLNAQGEPAGLFIDIWKSWARKKGVEVRFLFNHWQGSVQAVQDGLADFHCGFDSHDAWSVSSQPFYQLTAAIFFPAHRNFQTIQQLSHRKVATISSHYATILQQANPQIEVIPVRDYAELFSKLVNRQVDAFIDDQLVAMEHLRRQGRQGEFKTIRIFHHLATISAVIRKGDKGLQKKINQGLDAILLPELRELEKKWLPDGVSGFFQQQEKRLQLTAEEQAFLAEHPLIRISNERGWPPINFVKDDLPSGFSVEYIQLLADKIGLQLEFVQGDWQGLLQQSYDRELDVMLNIVANEERSRHLLFTGVYASTPTVIFCRQADRDRPKKIADLPGKRVAVVEGFYTHHYLRQQFPDLELLLVSSTLEGIKAVAGNEADALLDRLAVGTYLINTNFITNVSVSGRADIDEPGKKAWHLGVRNDWPLLHTILDKAMTTVSKEEMDHLRRRWYMAEDGAATASPSIRLTSREQEWIENHPRIRLAIDHEFMPFEYLDQEGRISGIASDYIGLLNRRLGLNMELVATEDWNDSVRKARNREVDVLPCVGKTEEREEFLRFSTPYIQFQRVIISRLDFPFISGLAQLGGRSVAVQENSSHHGFLLEQNNLKLLPYPSQQEALKAVSSGEADVFIANLATASFWIRKLNMTNLKVAASAQSGAAGLHFGIRSDWPELEAIINKGLASITQEEQNDIMQKWVTVEYEQGVAPKDVFRYISQIIGVAVLLILAGFLRNRRLKKELVLRRQVEDKLQLKAEELARANVHLQGMDRLKSMFIASMSHELRTPLNSIIGFTGVLLQGMSGEINPQQKDQLGRVYSSGKHLLSLISDVIDISKIEAGRIDVFPEPFQLTDIVDEAVLGLQPQLAKKKLTLDQEVPKDLLLTTDRKRLLQCLINYLSNGVKFTETGGVSLVAREVGDQVEITVTDTGIGITEEDIPKLFEAFERLDSRLRVKAGGTGLGLYLTKKLAGELLGGEIFVKSEVDRGSCFGLRIPKELKRLDEESGRE